MATNAIYAAGLLTNAIVKYEGSTCIYTYYVYMHPTYNFQLILAELQIPQRHQRDGHVVRQLGQLVEGEVQLGQVGAAAQIFSQQKSFQNIPLEVHRLQGADCRGAGRHYRDKEKTGKNIRDVYE